MLATMVLHGCPLPQLFDDTTILALATMEPAVSSCQYCNKIPLSTLFLSRLLWISAHTCPCCFLVTQAHINHSRLIVPISHLPDLTCIMSYVYQSVKLRSGQRSSTHVHDLWSGVMIFAKCHSWDTVTTVLCEGNMARYKMALSRTDHETQSRNNQRWSATAINEVSCASWCKMI